MKVILYMAISVNGLITDASGETPWCESVWERYKKTLQHAGCLIVGRRTHEIMDKIGEYEKLAVKRVVVLAKSRLELPPGMTAADDPDQAIAELEAEGFAEVVVGGGAETNKAFLEAGLVDEICLDIEPFLFGRGLPLLQGAGLNLNLRLVGVDRYAENSLGVRYLVLPSSKSGPRT